MLMRKGQSFSEDYRRRRRSAAGNSRLALALASIALAHNLVLQAREVDCASPAALVVDVVAANAASSVSTGAASGGCSPVGNECSTDKDTKIETKLPSQPGLLTAEPRYGRILSQVGRHNSAAGENKIQMIPHQQSKIELNLTGAALQECKSHIGIDGIVDLTSIPELQPMPLKEARKAKVYFQHISKAGGSTIGVNLPGWMSEHGPVNFDMVELRRRYVGGFDSTKWLKKTCLSRCGSFPGKPLKAVSAEKSYVRTKSYLQKGWFGLTALRNPMQRSLSTHNHYANKIASYGQRCGFTGAEFFYKCCREGAVPCKGCRSCERMSNWQAGMMLSCDRYSAAERKTCIVTNNDRIGEAIVNLDSFGMVMIIDHMDISQCVFFWKLNLMKQFDKHCVSTGFRKVQSRQGDTVNSHSARFKRVRPDVYTDPKILELQVRQMEEVRMQNSADQIIYDHAMKTFAIEVLGMIKAVQKRRGEESPFLVTC